MTAVEFAHAFGGALALGLPAFPCRLDKSPSCPHGYRDATADPVGLRELWRRYPGPLVGVPTGGASGIDVLDIDAPRHPEAAAWLAARRIRLPATRIHRTRSGGLHLLFGHRPGTRCWAGRPIAGVDGRGGGGYVVWWPVAGEPLICDAPPAPWPAWLLAELTFRSAGSAAAWEPRAAFRDHGARSRYAEGALWHAAQRVARAPVGTRNHALNSEAYGLGRLIAAGLLNGQAVADALAAAAMAAGLVPREIEATLRSAFVARGLL